MSYRASEDPSLVDTKTLLDYFREHPRDLVVITELEKRQGRQIVPPGFYDWFIPFSKDLPLLDPFQDGPNHALLMLAYQAGRVSVHQEDEKLLKAFLKPK